MLKGQVTEMTEKIETQLSNIQPTPSASPSYAEIARKTIEQTKQCTNSHLGGHDTIKDGQHTILHD